MYNTLVKIAHKVFSTNKKVAVSSVYMNGHSVLLLAEFHSWNLLGLL